MTASLVQKAGIDMGQVLLGPYRGNPRGHFEDVDFYRFHEDVLHRSNIPGFFLEDRGLLAHPAPADEARALELIGARQHRRYWGWKDPRTCLFLDFWDALLPDARYLFIYRHPLEVVLSLLRRGTDLESLVSPALALRTWHVYNRSIVSFLKEHRDRSALYHVSRVTKDAALFLREVGDKLQLSLDRTRANEIVHAEELHSASGAESSAAREALRQIAPDVCDLYSELESLADGPSLIRPDPPPRHLAQLQEFASTLPADVLEASSSALLTILLSHLDIDTVSKMKSEAQTHVKSLKENFYRLDTLPVLSHHLAAQTDRAESLAASLHEKDLEISELREQIFERQSKLVEAANEHTRRFTSAVGERDMMISDLEKRLLNFKAAAEKQHLQTEMMSQAAQARETRLEQLLAEARQECESLRKELHEEQEAFAAKGMEVSNLRRKLEEAQEEAELQVSIISKLERRHASVKKEAISASANDGTCQTVENALDDARLIADPARGVGAGFVGRKPEARNEDLQEVFLGLETNLAASRRRGQAFFEMLRHERAKSLRLSSQLQELQARSQELLSTLEKIHDSRAWSWVNQYWKVRKKLSVTVGKKRHSILPSSSEAQVAFVLPNGLNLGGVTIWSIDMCHRLLAQDRRPVLLHHENLQMGLDLPVPHAVPSILCSGQTDLPNTTSKDLAAYRVDYEKVLPAAFVPNYNFASYAACALLSQERAEEMRVLAFCHSDEDFYYQLLYHYEPIIHRFFCVSREATETVRALLPSRVGDVLNFPYAVDIPEHLDRSYSKPGQPLRLIYAGRIVTHQKRIFRLLDLAAALVDAGVSFQLELVGTGEQEQEFRDRLRGLPPEVRRSVRLRETVPPDEMASLWQGSDILVLVSEWEGTSIAMLEAMAHGCVPVVTRVSGTQAVIEYGKNGFLSPYGDIDQMCRHLKMLHDDRELLSNMGFEAHLSAAERYSYPHYLRTFLDAVDACWRDSPRRWPKERKLLPADGEVYEQIRHVLESRR